jgi:hypothetical protein
MRGQRLATHRPSSLGSGAWLRRRCFRSLDPHDSSYISTMTWVAWLLENRTGRLATAGGLLTAYLAGLGMLASNVPGRDYSGCPPQGPCDPLIFHPHDGFVRTFVVLAVIAVAVPLGTLVSTRLYRVGGALLGLTLAVGGALAGMVLVLIRRSPLTCVAGAGLPDCPPSMISGVLFIALGGMLVAFALTWALRAPSSHFVLAQRAILAAAALVLIVGVLIAWLLPRRFLGLCEDANQFACGYRARASIQWLIGGGAALLAVALALVARKLNPRSSRLSTQAH